MNLTHTPTAPSRASHAAAAPQTSGLASGLSSRQHSRSRVSCFLSTWCCLGACMALLLLLSGAFQPLRADVIYSNTGTSSTLNFAGGTIAQSFVVPASGTFTLSSVDLILRDQTNSHPFFVNLTSNNSGTPGSVLEILSGTNDPVAAGTYTFTSSGSALTAGTAYWIWFGHTGSGIVARPDTDGGPEVGSTLGSAYTENGGTSWTTGIPYSYQMIVNTPTASPALAATFWKGQTNTNWSGANWASDATGTATTAKPISTTDLTFSATGAGNKSTVLDTDFTIKTLTVKDTIGISGSKTLTISGLTTVGDGGTLTINSGTSVKSLDDSVIEGTGAGATVTVTGANAKWDTTKALGVGATNLNTGTLNVLLGAQVTARALIVADDFGSTGTVTINGANSKLTSDLSLIGLSGTGTLNIQAGGQLVTNTFAVIAAQTGAVGVVNVIGAGSKWNITNDLTVDSGGDGTLNIKNGGVVTNTNAYLSTFEDDKATVLVDGAGSKWTSSGELQVGVVGPATLDVKNGGVVESVKGTIGVNTGSVGTVTVDGSGSKWTLTGDLSVGASGTGTLNIKNGGTVTSVNGTLGAQSGSTGTATVDGAGSKWTILGNLISGSSGSGTLNITNGGVVSAGSFLGGNNSGSTSTVTVDGAGSLLKTTDGGLYVNFVGTGSLTVQNGGSVSAADFITIKSGGSMTVQSGGTVTNKNYVTVNNGTNPTVVVTGAGSKWTISTGGRFNGGLYIGNEETGNMKILAGGQVSSGEGYVGYYGTGTMTVDGAGSKWDNAGLLHVGEGDGNAGTGTLTVQNGGVVTSASGTIGVKIGDTGTVTVTDAGSKWTMTGDLSVDTGGTGTLNITKGGVVSDVNGKIATTSGGTTLLGTVTVDGAGSKWTNSGEVIVGDTGPGVLNIQNGGQVDVNGGAAKVTLGKQAGSSGTLNIGKSDLSTTAGVLNAGEVFGGAGTATVNFNQTDSLTFAPKITGKAEVNQLGTGKTTLTGISTYTGDTTVSDGTLEVSGGGQITATRDLTVGIIPGKTPIMNVSGAGSSVTVTRYLTVGNDITGAASGTLNITNGGQLTANDEASFGYYAPASVTVDGIGSTLTLKSDYNYLGDFSGYYGAASTSLTVTNQGTFNYGSLKIGYHSFVGETSTLTVDGVGSTAVGDTLVIGTYGKGTATLNVLKGGKVTSNYGAFLGDNYGSAIANVDGAGSTWTISGAKFKIGYSYSGSSQVLNITNGGKVDVTGANDAILGYYSDPGTTATVNVDGAGSIMKVGGKLTVAIWSGDVGTLNLKNGGVVTVGDGTGIVSLAEKAGGKGTLNIGSFGGTDTAGTLNAAEVKGGPGTAVLNFNQTNSLTFAPLISGSVHVNQNGYGTTTFAVANTYTGGTTINDGGLQTGNSSALGTGPVVLNNGALRTVGPLKVSSLKWTNGFIALEPTQGDVINVTGAFTNGGSGGIFAIGPQDLVINQHYTLVSFGSQLGFTLGQFSAISTNPDVQYKSTFFLNGDSVQIAIIGATAQGNRLHNIENGVPTFADYTTNGNVISGLTESGFQELKTYINNLFVPNSTLTVPGPNSLFVAGDTNVSNSLVVVNGVLQISGDYHDPSSTTLVNNVLTVGGTTTIAANSVLYVASSGVFTTGVDLNVSDSVLTVDGVAFVGGSTNLYSGATATVNGVLQSPAVNVFHGASLSGSGTVVGNVSNSGIVSPGNGIGTLHITGNYRQANDGSLVIQLAGPQSHDQLAVSGRASLGGTLRIQDVGGIPVPQRGGPSYRVLSARGGVSGTFTNVISPYAQGPGSLVYLGAQYTGNAVLIAPTQNTFANALSFLKLTPNQTATAAALDSALNDARQDAVLTHLDNGLRITQVPHALDLIAPEELTSIYTLGFSQSDSFALSLDQRFADIRSGGPDTPVLAGPAPSGKNAKAVAPVQEATEDHYGFFVTATGNATSLDGSYNAKGYDIETGGTAIGIDVRLSKSFVVGFTAGYARTDTDLTGGGKVKVDGGRVGLYGLYHHESGVFAQALVTGGYNSYDTERAALDGRAKGSTHGGQFDAAVTLGYDAKLGSFTVTPLASLLYTNVGLSGYDEQGSLEPLRIGNQTEESLRSRFGVRAAYTAKVRATTITPSVSAQWQHEFDTNELGLSSRFANGAGDTFTVHGPRTGRDSALVTAALNVSWDRYAWYAAYQTSLARSNVTDQTVSVGFRVAW